MTKLNRIAVAHPFALSLPFFFVLAAWVRVVSGLSLRSSWMFAAVFALLNMLLWIPRVGPLWKYSKRKIDEFDARQPVMQEHEPGQ